MYTFIYIHTCTYTYVYDYVLHQPLRELPGESFYFVVFACSLVSLFVLFDCLVCLSHSGRLVSSFPAAPAASSFSALVGTAATPSTFSKT